MKKITTVMDSDTKKPCHVLMLFDTEINLGISNKPEEWVNFKNIYFDNGTEALNAYANIPCPASQLITADDEYELKALMGQMILNYKDKNWLNNSLYPYL